METGGVINPFTALDVRLRPKINYRYIVHYSRHRYYYVPHEHNAKITLYRIILL